MAEPRKVQFVTLSAFAPGAAAESRKRRLEENGVGFNFTRTAEVEETVAAAGARGKAGDRDTAGAEKRATVRLDLSLSEPDDRFSAEFNYGELVQNLQVKFLGFKLYLKDGTLGLLLMLNCLYGLVIARQRGGKCTLSLSGLAWLKLGSVSQGVPFYTK